MNDTPEVTEFEALADAIANVRSKEEYEKANQLLTNFTNDLANFDKIHAILDQTK